MSVEALVDAVEVFDYICMCSFHTKSRFCLFLTNHCNCTPLYFFLYLSPQHKQYHSHLRISFSVCPRQRTCYWVGGPV